MDAVGGVVLVGWLAVVGVEKGLSCRSCTCAEPCSPQAHPTHPDPSVCADLGPELFLAWCAWACVWAGIFILLLAFTNACVYINHFTRFAGELFGALIAVSAAA